MAADARTELHSDDLPSMFREADKVSLAAQRRFTRLKALDLAFLIVAAAFGSLVLNERLDKILVALAIATVMTIGLILSVTLQRLRPERAWFDGRVIAESVKTLSYRYMMRSEQYKGVADSQETDEQFMADLRGLLADRVRLRDEFFSPVEAEYQITRRMREVRRMGMEERRQWYSRHRLRDQETWYAKKARVNEQAARKWFVAATAGQAAAVVGAIILARYPEAPINLTGLFATLAAASLAWLQLKQHQTLAQSYDLAAQELRAVQTVVADITTDDALSAFVSNAEMAVSREHTMWRARKDRE
jgi:hypothetical protein